MRKFLPDFARSGRCVKNYSLRIISINQMASKTNRKEHLPHDAIHFNMKLAYLQINIEK